MKQLLIFSFCLILLTSGCQTVKYLSITDGSKADGTLTMAYEYGLFEQPIVQWGQAKQSAIATCQNWGYSGAQFFDVGYTQCVQVDACRNCTLWRVTYKCQCTN